MKIDKFTVFKKVGEIDKHYVMEADNAYANALALQEGRERPIRRVLDWLNSGFGVALICLLVAGGVMAGIIYAGNVPDDPTISAGSLEPSGSEEAQENYHTDGADTIPTDGNSSAESTDETVSELSDVERVLALAPDMTVPEGTEYRSDAAFFTRVFIDGTYTSKVMRIMITDSFENSYNRFLVMELLDDDGTVIESHTMVMPNLGFLCYLRPDPIETEPAGGPADTFVFIGLQINDTFAPRPEGSEPRANVVLLETYLSWEETDDSDRLLKVRDQSRYVGLGSEWDAEFVAELQAELDEIVPYYAERFTDEIYIAWEDDCASKENAEKKGYTLEAEIWQDGFLCDALESRRFAYEIFGGMLAPELDTGIDTP